MSNIFSCNKMELKYKREKELERTYGACAVCGYLRSPTVTEEGRVKGICALVKDQVWRCKKALPMDVEDCHIYKERFK